MQTLAEPGGICLSLAAYDQVRGKIEADFADMGAHQVKNIARPVAVFALAAKSIDEIPRYLQPRAAPARGTWRKWLAAAIGAFVLLAAIAGGVYELERRAARVIVSSGRS